MDLFEYQARDLFEKHGVPVLAGAVATTDDEAFKAASAMGGKVVVKAQVKVGGRGKAGGVKLAVDADDAKVKAGAILGMNIKGHTVHQVMIAQAAPIVDEYYISILLDRSNRTFLVMPSGKPWLKPHTPIASARQRFQMADLAITSMGLSGKVEVLPLEVNRDGDSYTLDTVNELSINEYPFTCVVRRLCTIPILYGEILNI